MPNFTSTLDEFDIVMNLQFPHTLPASKTILASNILQRSADDILLISPSGFENSAILSGISEKQIEAIAKKAPAEHKISLIRTMSNPSYLKEIFEIAKSLDENIGNNCQKNQLRVKNVIRYIKDNFSVFQF